jgi:hypothetical protein
LQNFTTKPAPDWCYVFFKESVTVLMSCVKESEQMDALLLYYLDLGIARV